MQAKSLKVGDLIEVVDFYGETLTRKAVEISDDTVYICTAEEWDAAQKSGRDPICVGFKIDWVQPCHGCN